MNIVFSLCDGKLTGLPLLYVVIIIIMVLSLITGLIITYNEKNSLSNKREDIGVITNKKSDNIVNNNTIMTSSSAINHFNTVTSVTNDNTFIDNTIRIETLEEDPVIDIIDSSLDVNRKDQDVTITYME